MPIFNFCVKYTPLKFKYPDNFLYSLKIIRSFIDGKWVTPAGEKIPKLNPATEETIHKVASARASDVKRALESSKKAFYEWSRMPVEQRTGLLKNFGQLMTDEMDEISRVITLENGKPLIESSMEVTGAQMYVDYYSSEAVQMLREETRIVDFPQPGNYEFRIAFEPLGVVAVISPWNWPFLIPIQTIIPAIVAGNTVVFKPSSLTAMVGEKIAELFEKTGLPKGVFNMVQGGGRIGEMLVESDVKAVVFTGSSKVGSQIALKCAKGFKRTVLELGGSDPFIVFDDANMEEAVNGAVYGRFFGAGQICVSAKRILVHHNVFNEFVKRFTEKASSLRVGNGFEPSTDMGPLISSEQRSYVSRVVRQAVLAGARVTCGGSAPKELKRGFFYSPTVLTEVNLSMRVMTEEIFGPVAPVMPFRDEKQAIEIANATKYGLGASIWTQSEEKAIKLSREIESGIVWVNDVAVTFPHAPWGGVKQSGLGRHSSRYGLLEMVNIRQICINRVREPTRMWWLPYAKG